MAKNIYRDGVLLAGDAVTLSCNKTLGATGELDLWPSSGAMVIPAGGELSIVSSSAQDAATITDKWTITGAEGTGGFAATITVDDTEYSCFPLGPDEEFTGLDDAMANGSKTAWVVVIDTIPDAGDIITLAIDGGASYPLTITTEVSPDDVASALATLMAADPDYDVVAVATFGALALKAKIPAVAAGDVSVTLSDTGDATATQVVFAGPACTTHTAAVVGSSLVITALVAGVPWSVTAITDNLVATHTLTGGAGSGLQSLRVHYLTATGDRVSETITMAGTTGVTTNVAHSVFGFLGAESLAGTAAGTITIKREDTTTIASIVAGDSETHNIYVATGDAASEAFTVTGLQVSNGSGTIATLRIRSTGPTGAKLHFQGNAGLSTNHAWDFRDDPIVIGPESTLKVTAEGNGAVLWVALTGFYGRG